MLKDASDDDNKSISFSSMDLKEEVEGEAKCSVECPCR